MESDWPDINPDEFRVSASDAKGHSERIWGRVMPMVDRQMGEIVSKRYFPYKGKADLVRHAIDRHLKWLHTLRPMPSVMKQVEAINIILREEDDAVNFREVFEKTQATANARIAEGHADRARVLIAQVSAEISLMPEESWWKKRYEEEIEQRWGHMFKGQGSVSLRGSEKNE